MLQEDFPTVSEKQLSLEQRRLTDEVAAQLPQPSDLGRVLSRHGDWPPPWPVWLIMFGLGLPLLLIPGQSLASNAFVYVGSVLLIALFVFSTGLAYAVTVREHAVVLQTRLPGFTSYVLPIWSLNPARVRLHTNSPAIQRRLGGENAFEGWRRHYRTSIYSRTCVSLEGFALEAEDGDSMRVRPSRPLPGQRSLAVGGPGWKVFGEAMRFPLTTWFLSVRKPEELLAAIERALVESGRESARGLAAWVLSHPVHENRKNPLAETTIYGADPYPWFGPEETPPA